MKIAEKLMWVMFLVTSVIALLTIIVTFGMMEYKSQLSAFANLLPLEISLSATLFFWGVNSMYSTYLKNGKKTFFLYFVMGGLLLVFIFMGVY